MKQAQNFKTQGQKPAKICYRSLKILQHKRLGIPVLDAILATDATKEFLKGQA